MLFIGILLKLNARHGQTDSMIDQFMNRLEEIGFHRVLHTNFRKFVNVMVLLHSKVLLYKYLSKLFHIPLLNSYCND